MAITRQREAAEQLSRLRLQALADGLEQGREYVPDPNDPPVKSTAHYSLKPYVRVTEALERAAYPWLHTLARRIRRREAEEDADFAKFEAAAGRMNA